MAKHQITLHKNCSWTKDKAPCTASYISRETIRALNKAKKISDKAGMSMIEFVTIITSAFDAIAEREKDGLIRIHLDGFTVCGIITGSLPSADSSLDEDNKLQLAIYVNDEIRNCIVNETPEIIGSDNATRLRVDSVMDLEVPRPMNLVHGQHRFRVAGYNMIMTDEGACAYFEDAKGVMYPAVLDEAITEQLCVFHSEELLEGGDYKFVVKSRAGDIEGPLQSDFRKVKYLKVLTPPTVTVTGGTAKFDAAEGTLSGELDGENLDFLEGDTLTFKHGDTTGTCTVGEDSTSTKIKYVCDGEVASFDWVGTEIEFTLKSRGGVASAPVQTVVKTLTIEEA